MQILGLSRESAEAFVPHRGWKSLKTEQNAGFLRYQRGRPPYVVPRYACSPACNVDEKCFAEWGLTFNQT